MYNEIKETLNKVEKDFKECRYLNGKFKFIDDVSIYLYDGIFFEIISKHFEYTQYYDNIEEFSFNEDLEYMEHYLEIKLKDNSSLTIPFGRMLV